MIYVYAIIFIVAVGMNALMFTRAKLPVLIAALAGLNLTVFAIYLPSLMLALLGALTVPAVAMVLMANICLSSWVVFRRGGLVISRPMGLSQMALGLLAVSVFAYLIFYNFAHCWAGNLGYSSFSSMLQIEGNPFPQHISYGTPYLLPYLFQKYGLAFLVHYLSATDPSAFILNLAPVTWALVQMGLVAGIYAVFKTMGGRSLPALFLGLIFIHYAVAQRFLTVVGESYGWVAGFGFASLTIFLLKHERRDMLLWLTVGLSFFVTVNVHGVAAFICLLMVLGYFLYRMNRNGWQRTLSNWRQMAAGVLVFLLLVGVGKALIDDPSGRQQRDLFALNHATPKKGMTDYGLVYRNILSNQEARPLVREAPYDPWPTFLEAVGKKAFSGLTGFTEKSVALLPLMAMLAYLVFKRKVGPEIWACGAMLLGMLAFAIYLNSTSSAAYPAMIVFRRFNHHIQAAALLLSVSVIYYFLSGLDRIWNDKVLLIAIIGLVCAIMPKPDQVFGQAVRIGATETRERIERLSEVIAKYGESGYSVVATVRTINMLGFLTKRRVISEGRGPYQQYGIMKKIVTSMDELRHFFQNPDLSYLRRNNIDLVIVCQGINGVTLPFASVTYEKAGPLMARQPYLRLVYQNDWIQAYKVASG